MEGKLRVPVGKLTKVQLLALDVCSRCAICAEYCPVYEELSKPEVIPGKKAELLRKLVKREKGIRAWIFGPKPTDPEELREIADSLYLCSLCGRCFEVCPFSIKTHELWERARSIIYDVKYHPEPLKVMDRAIIDNKNPYGSPVDIRSFWTDFVNIEVPIEKKADTVYFVGCTPSLRSRTQVMARSVSLILDYVKENWTILGNEEWCCGSPSMMIGNEKEAKELAKHNVKAIEAIKAKRVVVSCPACYRSLKYRYPALLGRSLNFEVVHIAVLIDYYLKKGKLVVRNRFDEKLVYHDPCELARLGGIVKEPRRILRVVTRNFMELPESGVDGRCCGGGGLLQAVDNELRIIIAQRRIEQVEKVSAEILVTACPSCNLTLSEAAERMGNQIRVIDLTDLVIRSLT